MAGRSQAEGGRLDGRTAAVSGGASGIGRAVAEAYAREGAAVVIGDVDAAAGEELAAAIGAAGGRAAFASCDVASPGDCRALVQTALARFGGLDVMHANAGIEHCAAIWDTSDADWQRVIDVNLGGAFYCCREAMRAMRDRGRPGVVTFTASPHAFLTAREIAAYAASKGGMVALMRAAALEGAPHGIRVNAILPGAVRTPMLEREAAGAPDTRAQLERFAAQHPLGRMGEPQDVARVAVFLASDEAAFVTGACYAVDGGMTAVLSSGPSVSYGG
jgi:NAD(P)-dependent dehydrogenase (short-subunit alcohol dehydrogenase family)